MKKSIFILSVAVLAGFVSCKDTKKTNEEAGQTTPAVEASVKQGAITYKAVVAETIVDWVGSKPAGKHNGTIGISQGEVSVDGTNLVGGKFTLDINSIQVLDLQGDEKGYLEGHLKGTAKPEDADHFFNVSKFPTGEFVITNYADGKLTGNLTLKGVTKEISFPAKVQVTEHEVVISSETFTINRVDFGVNYGSKSIFDNLKDKYINDEIELSVKAKAIK